jgi:AAA+ superfamily predicted ATPase
MHTEIELTPAQRLTADGLAGAISANQVLLLRCSPGKGRSTILRSVHHATGGSLVHLKDYIASLMGRQPAAVEEAFLQLIEDRLAQHRCVFVDDFHLIRNIVQSYEYPRQHMLDVMMTALLDKAEAEKKTILFALDDERVLPSIAWRASVWKVGDFTASDYEVICRRHLSKTTAEALDYARIHRFAPMLNLWQLKNACSSLSRFEHLDTDKFVDYLGVHNLVSNVEIEEVRPVQLRDIKGLDDVVEALEVKIALPFENPVLAAELDLKARRGVLLAGPPGTGKTTIGRALAHRLKSKFFLIDGTAISGSGDFYETIQTVFAAARRNAPSIIFIDDADVMFEGNEDRGLYRYLLTELDGLQSASAERVCVMMTAMDPGNLPPALLRSGRVELWLETRLPDAEARATIFRESLSKLPHPICEADCTLLASASNGLTGADLCSLIEDGKLLFAHDKAKAKTPRPIEEYFLRAIDTIRENRRNYGKRRPAPFKDIAKIGFDRT